MTRPKVTIRKARAQDIPAILVLMREFAGHANLSEYLETDADRLGKVMFGKDAFVRGLVAADRDSIVAYALYLDYFASFRGQKGIYLEDIYVTEANRGSGVGEMMISEIAKLGAAGGAVRMDFQVLRSNRRAIGFYKKLGADPDQDERHYKFTDDAFSALIR